MDAAVGGAFELRHGNNSSKLGGGGGGGGGGAAFDTSEKQLRLGTDSSLRFALKNGFSCAWRLSLCPVCRPFLF